MEFPDNETSISLVKSLTDRQRQCLLAYLRAGNSKVAARNLDVNMKTLEATLAQTGYKLGVRKAYQMAVIATKAGLL